MHEYVAAPAKRHRLVAGHVVLAGTAWAAAIALASLSVSAVTPSDGS